MSGQIKPVGELIRMKPETIELLEAIRAQGLVSTTKLLQLLPHVDSTAMQKRLMNLRQQGYIEHTRDPRQRSGQWNWTGREPLRSTGMPVQAEPEAPAPVVIEQPRDLFVGVPAAERGALGGGPWTEPYLSHRPARPGADDFRACGSRRAGGVVHCYQR